MYPGTVVPVHTHPETTFSALHLPIMQEQEQPGVLDRLGDAAVPRLDAGSSNNKTPRYLITLFATQLACHLRTLPAIQKRPDLIPTINRLQDFETLYRLAVMEKQEGFTRNIAAVTAEVLQSYKLKESDLGTENIAYIQSSLQAIFTVFRNKVFATAK
jgi:hypothetical protein